MSDIVTSEKRSEIMRASKPKGNLTTEKRLIKIFKQLCITGWRRNYKVANSCPDFVFRNTKIAIFADGCFWHGHNCRNVVPKTNPDYWSDKIEKNKKRDQDIVKRLESKGWTVFRIWECEIKRCKLPPEILQLSKKHGNTRS